MIRMERPRVYGGILRTKADEYALVQGRYTGKWSFPKGHSNDGETPMECTKREIAEETGLVDLPTPEEYLKIGYGNYYVFPMDKKVKLHPRDEQEIINTTWATLEEMDLLLVNVDVSKYMKDRRKRGK